jgi:tRNA (guanosine-2'-O-)-methyltransferase
LNKGLIEYLSSFFTATKLESLNQILCQRTKHLTVVLEDVYQPQNASAVIRSCDCFGIQDLYVIEHKNKYKINPRVAMGASKWVNVHRYSSLEMQNATSSCIHDLKQKGYQIVATSPHHQQCTPNTIDLSKPLAIFFGNEKEGLSDYVLSNADHYLCIPMYGFTESLNISVSAAVVMKSLYERLVQESQSWRLSEQEQEELKLQWMSSSLQHADVIIQEYYKTNA